MHHRKRFGCHVYPLLFLLSLAVPGLMAQNSTQSQPENPQQNQIRLAQEAQARIHARREQRKQQVIQNTYTHKFEAYGGGGYTRYRPGSSLQHINESAWNVGLTDYLWGRLHGADRLIDIVASALPSGRTLHAGVIAGLKRDIFHAILGEERGRLKHVPELIETLEREIG